MRKLTLLSCLVVACTSGSPTGELPGPGGDDRSGGDEVGGDPGGGDDVGGGGGDEVTPGDDDESPITHDDEYTVTHSNELFPPGYTYNKDVSALPKSSRSDDILTALDHWGAANHFQIGFDFDIYGADNSTPTAVADYVAWPDESDVIPFPEVPGGTLESESSYHCPNWNTDDSPDCHYIVINPAARRLYELYQANQDSPGHWGVLSMAVWDLDRAYPNTQRGFGCTSGDAAGLPITAGLIRVREIVVEQEMRHALRFILPNPQILAKALVPPAAHYGGPSGTNTNLPPYGIRLRLRADYPESSIATSGGKIVVRALKKYGMILADGGQVALTAERDDHTSVKYDDTLHSDDLEDIRVSDFEVVDLPAVQTFTTRPDCTLDNPL